ncbi:hypothetical protein K458DRAFT_384845 [Lentithecium fluviatile CBS 122367]|uniref:t-SNARE coiled-coil homology domain-containing protein n=1 Tax=Lentithecium fluviatile CBS 122367 TaxID=1168545 RepID=A0A6G1JDL6_9PLEO|nr:hypothetical protein K458DRAFT_384845 [Lentithecium fluviatile CBS 122367]
MSNRFGRDSSRNDLFSSYNRSTSPSKTKGKGRSPYGGSPGYGYTPPSSTDHLGPSFGAYPGANGTPTGSASGRGSTDPVFRSATPNSRGQYSAAVLDELESQNEEQVGVLSGKVKMLKDVSLSLSYVHEEFGGVGVGLTVAIGDEIRDSTSLAEKMNDQFESSRLKIRGTMNRMLRMAQKTGVGWKVWLGFFAVVGFLFWYVWLF